jgi:hypothetical protein
MTAEAGLSAWTLPGGGSTVSVVMESAASGGADHDVGRPHAIPVVTALLAPGLSR